MSPMNTIARHGSRARRRRRLLCGALATTALLVWLLPSGTSSAGTGSDFIRGDANADGVINVVDPIVTFSYLAEGSSLPCMDGADANDDGAINVVDIVYVLSFMFAGTASPPLPFPGCGPDPTPEGLGCDIYSCP